MSSLTIVVSYQKANILDSLPKNNIWGPEHKTAKIFFEVYSSNFNPNDSTRILELGTQIISAKNSSIWQKVDPLIWGVNADQCHLFLDSVFTVLQMKKKGVCIDSHSLKKTLSDLQSDQILSLERKNKYLYVFFGT